MFKKLLVAGVIAALCAMPLFAQDLTIVTDEAVTSISGFVDASYSGNLNTNENTFGLDQAEIDVARLIGDGAGALRVDVEWVKVGNGWQLDAEQGYMDYRMPFCGKVTMRMGKWNVPIGFEALDAPDMFQFSHTLVFDHGLPTNATGLMAMADVGYGVNLTAYATNGMDMNENSNEAMTYGGQVGYSMGEKFFIHLSYISGTEDQDQLTLTTITDIDFGYYIQENWIVGGEYNMGTFDNGTDDFGWNGFMVMTHYDFTEMVGLTVRYGSFTDSDAYVFGWMDANGNPAELTLSELTIAPTFYLGNGMGALIEYRMDMAGEDYFDDGDDGLTKSKSTIAFEMTYTF